MSSVRGVTNGGGPGPPDVQKWEGSKKMGRGKRGGRKGRVGRGRAREKRKRREKEREKGKEKGKRREREKRGKNYMKTGVQCSIRGVVESLPAFKNIWEKFCDTKK